LLKSKVEAHRRGYVYHGQQALEPDLRQTCTGSR